MDRDLLFRQLVDEHRRPLYHFILRRIGNEAEAEDLAQQAFIDAYESFARFRGESQLSTWLYGIALNLVRNHLSRSPARRYVMDSDEEGLEILPDGAPGPERETAEREIFLKICQEMAELPVEMREALILVGVEGLSYEEAADLLRVPVGTVRSRLSRARSRLLEMVPV